MKENTNILSSLTSRLSRGVSHSIRTAALCGLLCSFAPVMAQKDPVVMRINGKAVTRSEFEYSYNKNNSEGVIDKKSVQEYVPLFVAYKLKVLAAEDAHLDTLKSFKNEFATYRNQQIRPAMIDSTDIEAKAREIYTETQQQIDGNGGMVKVAHILVRLTREANEQQQAAAKAKADSIYKALKNGADFATLAKELSQDPGTAKDGGELPWIVKGQTIKEFEAAAWALKDNELSEPVKTAAGWHIILKKGAQKFYDYASQRPAILNFIKQRGMDEELIDAKLDSLAKKQGTTKDKILETKLQELQAKDGDLKYLVQEYHDGLLLYEIANKTVWQKAQADTTGQQKYFALHRNDYKWDEPRFKGIAYRCRHAEDVEKVKDAVAKKPFDEWADILRTTFNSDSVLRIRVEKGIFKKGMNTIVDKEVYGSDSVKTVVNKEFPHTSVFGKKLTAPESLDDVRQQVVSDYQDELEKQWVDSLKKRYKVKVDEKVLATVNKH